MNQHDAFLRTIEEKPGDDGPKLVYADWLEEHGDPRGELIRLSVELNRIRQRLQIVPVRIEELSRHVHPDWLIAVFGRFRATLIQYPPDRKIQAIKHIRDITGYSLLDSKNLSETLPAVVVDGVPWSVVERVRRLFAEFDAVIRVEPSLRTEPLPAGAPFVVPLFRIVLRSHLTGAKLQTIKALRSLTNLGVTAARELVESLPRVLRERATREDVERFRAAFRPFAEIDAMPMDLSL